MTADRAADVELGCRVHWPENVCAADTHYCVKDVGHVSDVTNDDHRCCCGATFEE